MKTLVVLSDSHGRRIAVERVAPLFAENDLVVHLGDGFTDLAPYAVGHPEKFRFVRGNCDFSYCDDELVVEAEGVRVFCCHGHRYGVKHGLEKLVRRAKELGCGVALYGHTHRADVRTEDGVLLVNPGALGDYAGASYCYLVLHAGKATPTVVPLD